ncbi:hypothetical protein [Halorientalis salina]|uniref:hypothetical protein n=1 Tax=Halorientalis salina TaxID=2932266 RepID=UPI0010AD308F|nr:hypothetical protein [Halorientalis salina]
MSTGVAYAAPLAGLGGFDIAATEISADNMVLYPGVGDTSTREYYPQTIVELQDVQLRNLWLYKTLDLSSTPGLTGQARVFFVSAGTSNAENVVVKSTAVATDGEARFEDFAIEEERSSDPRGQFEISADGPVTFERPRINAHYLASGTIVLSNINLMLCYDPDGDDEYEMGACPSGDPISQSYRLSDRPNQPDPTVSEGDDQWAFDGPIRDIGESIGDVTDTVTKGITDGISDIGDTIDDIF